MPAVKNQKRFLIAGSREPQQITVGRLVTSSHSPRFIQYCRGEQQKFQESLARREVEFEIAQAVFDEFPAAVIRVTLTLPLH